MFYNNRNTTNVQKNNARAENMNEQVCRRVCFSTPFLEKYKKLKAKQYKELLEEFAVSQ